MAWALSALGDTALLAPASLAFLAFLLAVRRWRDARAFVASLVLGLGATLVSKLLFKACGGTVDILGINSPSGHASFATLFYGALAIMIATGRGRWTASLVGLGALAIVAAIGASRAVQEAHSWAEVVVGWAIGLGGLAAFAALRQPLDPKPLSPVPIAVGLALAILLLGGRHYTPERQIGRFARAASSALDVCTPPRVTGLQSGPAIPLP